MNEMKAFARVVFKLVLDLLLLLPAIAATILARFISRAIDVGMGPEPLISYVYHKQALAKAGYSAETYVVTGNHISCDYDINAEVILLPPLNILRWHYLFFKAVFRYRCLYFSFHGGPLMGTVLLRILEPHLLRLAGIKTVILPYGSDVQDMTRCPNHSFIAAVAKDYPNHRLTRKRVSRQIDRWTYCASHIVAGCDWIDYMYHWDTITLNNFSIDTDYWAPDSNAETKCDGTIRILHSPNHRAIKGTTFFENAVNALRNDGLDVELVVLERASNEEVKRVMSAVDIVADQLIIGWYAMFAMEGMALGKPVLCYLRPDLKTYYFRERLIEENELPLVECSPENVTEVIRSLVANRQRIYDIGAKSRKFVVKHHSLSATGATIGRINSSIGLLPSNKEVDG